MNKKIILILFFLILCAGALLRIYKLGAWDFWFDEVISICAVKGNVSHDIQPPLYYSLLSLWLRLFTENEFNLRALSALFGFLSIAVIYKIGKALFSARTGLLSALIIAISPMHIWYAQEARGYTLSVFLTAVTAYYFILALRENKNMQWFKYGIFAALSMYASYYSLLVIFAEGSLFFYSPYRPLAKKWFLARLLSFGALFIWLPIFYRQIININEIFWLSKPSFQSIIITFENFNVGYSATKAVYLFSFVIYLILAVNGMRFLRNDKKKLLFLLAYIILPLSMVYFVSRKIPIYLDRQLMAFSPFYYLIIAVGIDTLRKRSIKIFFIASIILLSSISLYRYFNKEIAPLYHHEGVHLKKPFKPAAQYLKENIRSNDIIAYANSHSKVLEHYYANDSIVHRFFFIPSSLDRYTMKSIQRDEKGGWNAIDLSKGILQYNFKRIWLVTGSWERVGKIDQNSAAVKEYLEKYYTPVQKKDFEGMYLELYESNVN